MYLSTNQIARLIHACSGVAGGVWGRGQSAPPETSDREISADLLDKKMEENMEKGEKKFC